MNLLELMFQRRSVRKYTGERIPEEKLEKVLQAGLLAPTSMNRQPCRFYLVQDKAVLKQLSKAKKAGAKMLADAEAAVVVVADADKADTWVEDSSIALSYMNLMAEELGLGACWVQFHFRSTLLGKDAEAVVREALGIQEQAAEKNRVVGALSLGMPAAKGEAKTEQDLDWSKVTRL